MEKLTLTVKLGDETDALWALLEIAKQIVGEYKPDDYRGVKWQLTRAH